MNIKRIFAILLVITCLSAFLTGCGLIQIDDEKPTDEENKQIIDGVESLIPGDLQTDASAIRAIRMSQIRPRTRIPFPKSLIA